MAKAKKPAAKRRKGSATGKPAANSAVAKSSASAAASKASAATADVKTAANAARSSVSPSEMKKELEAKSKPIPAVAKAPSGTAEVKETVAPKAVELAEKSKVAHTETRTAAPAPVPAQSEKRGSVFLPLVLGGAIAAGLGYFASEYDFFGNRTQDTTASDELRESISGQETRLAALESVEPVEVPEVTFPELDTLSADVAAVSEKLTDMDARLSVLEKQPIANAAGSDDASQAAMAAAIAAYQRDFEALQATAADQQDEIAGLLESAQSVEQATADVARIAQQQGALTELNSAIGSGQPFAAALATLGETGVTDLPAALSDVAADGVPTLNALQTEFPASARASLAAARSSDTTEGEAGLGGFLKRQLGARSVTPREGDDPDAVLSRAEAAVREGRLNDALGELDVLPVPAQEAMQSWLDNARARQAAEAATKELSQSLTAN